MRSVICAVLIFMLAAGLSYAQQKPTPPRQSYRGYTPAVRGIGHYNAMLESMLDISAGMELTDKQMKKMEEIRIKYLKPIAEEMREFRKLHLSIYKTLQDPSFDSAKVKSELDKADALSKKMAYQFVDGVSMLRDTLGPEKYKEMNTASFRYRNNMMQLRQKQSERYKQNRQPDAVNDESKDSKDDTGGTDKKE